MRYKDQATSIFSEIADIIESSDNAENNIYDVLVNYIVGETDRNGYTPKVNRTILIDNNDRKVVVNDYKLLEIISQ